MNFLLLLDYDGTLTPIRSRPELALLSPRRRKFLRRLSRRSNLKMAIISGRKLSEIKKLVNLPGIIYVGNHGFEIEISGKRYVHPAAKSFIPTLRRVRTELRKAIKIKGVFIENKELTLSVHYRLTTDGSVKTMRKIFSSALRPFKRKIRITEGKKVIEIRPPVNWNKGDAVKWIIRKLKLKNYLPIYIGDDRTDEDAFIALKGVGFSLKVGKGGRSRADSRLGNVADVYRFLAS